jgi:lipid-binding SYLF domain-containing protein
MTSRALIGAVMTASLVLGALPALAADDAAEISKNANDALASLYANVAGAKALGAQAHAVLVFPRVTKAGLGIGGQSAEDRHGLAAD